MAKKIVVSRPVTGIVLAGGESSRFGRPKWRARLAGKTLLDRAIDVLQGWCGEVLVVARDDVTGDPEVVTDAARVVEDLPLGRGPLLGIASGLRASRTAANAVVACDMPFADPKLLQHLVRRLRGNDAAIPLAGGRPQVLHAVYHRRCAALMEDALARGVLAPMDLLNEGNVRVCYVDGDEWRSLGVVESAFFSANKPEDLRRARELIRRRRQPHGDTQRYTGAQSS